MKKYILPLMFIFCTGVALLVTGCLSRQPSMRESAEIHLEQRYGGTFEFFAPTGVSRMNPDVIQMKFRREGATEWADNILVVGHRQEDGSIVFRDNYIAVRFRHEMAAFIRDAANAVFGETIIFYRVSEISTLSPDLPANATFEEYSTDAESRIFADIVLREEQFEESLAEEFALKFQNAGIISTFNISVVSDDVFKTSADISLINPPIDPIEARQVARVNSNPTEIRVELRGE